MHTNLTRWIPGAVVVLTLGVAALFTPPSAQDGVAIRPFRFAPTPIAVAAGTRIVFSNEDDITHTVTSGTPEHRDGRFDHQLAGKGATATVELRQPGVYPYFCERHRSMCGEIRVN